MSARFIMAGLRFFPSAFLIGVVLMLVAPVDVVRVLCAIALACAAMGFGLHLYALKAAEPGTRDAVHKRLSATLQQLRGFGTRALATTGNATETSPPWVETIWPCVLR